MDIYDDYDEEYYTDINNYDDRIEILSLIDEGFSEETLADVLIATGLITDIQPYFKGSMEKLVFVYGDDCEVYSNAEIQFIENIDEIIVFPKFTMNLGRGVMICRTVAAKIDSNGKDALRDCVAFEKIVNKALEGFNIFFFLTQESVFFGARVFEKLGERDCAISSPIKNDNKLEEFIDELTYLSGMDAFIDYYHNFLNVLLYEQTEEGEYEYKEARRRRYWSAYYNNLDETEPNYTFSMLLEEVEEELSFIKPKKVNTYEMLFDAEEMMLQAELVEAENEQMRRTEVSETSKKLDFEKDETIGVMLNDPEQMIKLLKKRRGV